MTAILRYERSGTNHQRHSDAKANDSKAVFKVEKFINVNCSREGDRDVCPALPGLSRRDLVGAGLPAGTGAIEAGRRYVGDLRYDVLQDLATHWQYKLRRAKVLREATPADLAQADLWAVVGAHARYQSAKDLRTIKHWQRSVEISDAGMETYAVAALAEGVVILVLIFFLVREGLRNRKWRRERGHHP